MVVIDASALIEVLLNAESFPRLTAIVVEHDLHAPHLLDIETVHAFRRAVLGQRLAVSRAEAALEDFAGAADHSSPARAVAAANLRVAE
jgi:predicted nucleic acid-binding protein